jgi:hypothetical protein
MDIIAVSWIAMPKLRCVCSPRQKVWTEIFQKKNKASTSWHRQSWLSARDLFRSVLIRLAWQRHLCSQSILNVWRCFEDVSNCDNRCYSILFPSIEARLFLWILKHEFDLTCCFYYSSQKQWAPSLEGLSNFGDDLKSIVLLFSFAVGLWKSDTQITSNQSSYNIFRRDKLLFRPSLCLIPVDSRFGLLFL